MCPTQPVWHRLLCTALILLDSGCARDIAKAIHIHYAAKGRIMASSLPRSTHVSDGIGSDTHETPSRQHGHTNLARGPVPAPASCVAFCYFTFAFFNLRAMPMPVFLSGMAAVTSNTPAIHGAHSGSARYMIITAKLFSGRCSIGHGMHESHGR